MEPQELDKYNYLAVQRRSVKKTVLKDLAITSDGILV